LIDEIIEEWWNTKKTFWLYKLFQEKQMVIKRAKNKFEEKPSWMTSMKNWMVWHENQ